MRSLRRRGRVPLALGQVLRDFGEDALRATEPVPVEVRPFTAESARVHTTAAGHDGELAAAAVLFEVELAVVSERQRIEVPHELGHAVVRDAAVRPSIGDPGEVDAEVPGPGDVLQDPRPEEIPFASADGVDALVLEDGETAVGGEALWAAGEDRRPGVLLLDPLRHPERQVHRVKVDREGVQLDVGLDHALDVRVQMGRELADDLLAVGVPTCRHLRAPELLVFTRGRSEHVDVQVAVDELVSGLRRRGLEERHRVGRGRRARAPICYREGVSASRTRALSYLAYRALLAHPVKRVRQRGTGLDRFLASYASEGLVPTHPDDRAVGEAASACIGCGLCEVGCGLATSVPTLRSLGLHAAFRLYGKSSTELPFARDALQACLACQGCDPVCPTGVPIARIVRDLLTRVSAPPAPRYAAGG